MSWRDAVWLIVGVDAGIAGSVFYVWFVVRRSRAAALSDPEVTE